MIGLPKSHQIGEILELAIQPLQLAAGDVRPIRPFHEPAYEVFGATEDPAARIIGATLTEMNRNFTRRDSLGEFVRDIVRDLAPERA